MQFFIDMREELLAMVVECDRERLSQMLINLLSNAIKFTQHGSIVLAGRLVDEDTIELSVRDTGVGISEYDQQNVFRHFRLLG